MRKLAVLGVSTVLTLAAAEGVCRLRVHRLDRQTLEAALAAPREVPAGQEATLGDIIRLHPDDRIAYELRPDQRAVRFKGRPLSTNSLGFRGPEVPPAGPRTVTILGIGDSLLFGHGVGDGESYLDQLHDLLRAAHPDVDWRVINTGVPGYNTVMEVETLVQKGLAFEPDLVILGLCGNDYAPPTYVRVADDPLDPTRSFFLELLREKLAGEAPPRSRREALSHRETWNREEGRDPRDTPARYAELYGEEAFLDALDRLQRIAAEHGFPVLVFAINDAGDVPAMAAACAERGFPVARMHGLLVETLERETGKPFSWDLYMQSDLAVNPNNGHPSVRHNGMAARALLETLEERGWLAEWTGS